MEQYWNRILQSRATQGRALQDNARRRKILQGAYIRQQLDQQMLRKKFQKQQEIMQKQKQRDFQNHIKQQQFNKKLQSNARKQQTKLSLKNCYQANIYEKKLKKESQKEVSNGLTAILSQYGHQIKQQIQKKKAYSAHLKQKDLYQGQSMLQNMKLIQANQDQYKQHRINQLNLFKLKQDQLIPIINPRQDQKHRLAKKMYQGNFHWAKTPSPVNQLSEVLEKQIRQRDSIVQQKKKQQIQQYRHSKLLQLKQDQIANQKRLAARQNKKNYRIVLQEQQRKKSGLNQMSSVQKQLNKGQYYNITPTGHHTILNPIDKQYISPAILKQMQRTQILYK